MHKKLFIPGPTEVVKEVRDAMASEMIGHRMKEFSDLYNSVEPKLQQALYTKNRVLMFTSSATGCMEAVVRNFSKKKILCGICGAFSDRWYNIAIDNGKPTGQLKVEWGKAIKPEMVDEALKTGEYDVFTLVHNETSTGVKNPIEEIANVMKKYPEVIFAVDAVSSLTGYKIETDALGIDIILAGVQKCFALPPGLAVMSVSPKAIERAKTVENRGYYFDVLKMLKYDEKGQTPSTPSISHIYALNVQMDRMLKEGMENRFARHKNMADMVFGWAKEKGIELFPEKGYESWTVVTMKNNKNFNISELNKELGKRGKTISNGYGKLKEITFRIAVMGDLMPEDIKELLNDINDILKI
ncbi:MAG: aminotransferase [bacterium (Candidatus Stahlbacteria) CG23_combo_of_CG06-09_8_20_14_all_34_7]|nr:MAG: aminotransferase [bacterium (Candidatus Stahlbacteria) CG23_combo_of_CG06-09_8_20_14_all_34_7]